MSVGLASPGLLEADFPFLGTPTGAISLGELGSEDRREARRHRGPLPSREVAQKTGCEPRPARGPRAHDKIDDGVCYDFLSCHKSERS